jgi:hypothetical protein
MVRRSPRRGHPSALITCCIEGVFTVLVKTRMLDTIVIEMQRLLAYSKELRARSARTTANVAMQCDKSAELLARSEILRSALAKSQERVAAATPRAPSPPLRCPSCGRPLIYVQSRGASERQFRQWDYFTCSSCGSVQYQTASA